jgi:hypothetical protein
MSTSTFSDNESDSEQLEVTPIDPDQFIHQCIEMVQVNNDNIQNIIDHTMSKTNHNCDMSTNTFSDNESDSEQLEVTPIDPDQFIHQCIEMVQVNNDNIQNIIDQIKSG